MKKPLATKSARSTNGILNVSKLTPHAPVLIKGDCLEEMARIPDNSVDVILADPPFGRTRNPWDILIPLPELWKHYRRILKPGGVVLLFGQVPFSCELGCSNLEWLRYSWVWEKSQGTGHLNSKKMPLKCHEEILVFYPQLPIYDPQMTTGHPLKVSLAKHKANSKNNQSPCYGKADTFADYASTERFPRSVLKFKSDKQTTSIHPTQKPVDLLSYLIKTYSKPGAVILDNVMGSGSTGVACVLTGRCFIGIELNHKYFVAAKYRIMEAVWTEKIRIDSAIVPKARGRKK